MELNVPQKHRKDIEKATVLPKNEGRQSIYLFGSPVIGKSHDKGIMRYFSNVLKVMSGVFIIAAVSCHSTPEANNALIDFSTIQSSNRVAYDLEISIYNKDIGALKQNIINEITLNNGAITNDTVENIRTHRLLASIPKHNIAKFMEKIKTFGIVTDETLRSQTINIVYYESQIERTKNLLEKNNSLLLTTNNATDKIALEREIHSLQLQLDGLNRNREELENRIENLNLNITIFN
jgi:hypothetical protein